MSTAWDPSLRSSFVERAGKLTADAKPLWGRMNAGAMMAHLNDSLRMAFGDLPCKSKKLPLRYKPVRRLFIYYLPMPKSAPTAPELMARCSGALLDDERRNFAQLLDRCAAMTPASKFGEHPAFGDLDYKEYGALIAKHTDHHLRQFGL
jgi:Protein of unknown function (DUF1569)